jgi:hypothetical protein
MPPERAQAEELGLGEFLEIYTRGVNYRRDSDHDLPG